MIKFSDYRSSRLLKMNSRLWGMTPLLVVSIWLSTPMLCVLPVPVCPYTKYVPLYPLRTCITSGSAVFSNTSNCEQSGLKIDLKTNSLRGSFGRISKVITYGCFAEYLTHPEFDSGPLTLNSSSKLSLSSWQGENCCKSHIFCSV